MDKQRSLFAQMSFKYCFAANKQYSLFICSYYFYMYVIFLRPRLPGLLFTRVINSWLLLVMTPGRESQARTLGQWHHHNLSYFIKPKVVPVSSIFCNAAQQIPRYWRSPDCCWLSCHQTWAPPSSPRPQAAGADAPRPSCHEARGRGRGTALQMSGSSWSYWVQ